jgi:hypothetical protein
MAAAIVHGTVLQRATRLYVHVALYI